MKNMVSLIDTNVIINFITQRDDVYKKECFDVVKLCANKKFIGYIAFHSVSIIWYIMRKRVADEEARRWLKRVCDVFIVANATQKQVNAAIENVEFKDFEDCLQDECAVHAKADYIVTCNAKDFKKAKTTVVTPDIFLKLLI